MHERSAWRYWEIQDLKLLNELSWNNGKRKEKLLEEKRKRFVGYIPLAGSNNCRLDRQRKHRVLSKWGIKRDRERERREGGRHEGSFVRGTATARLWTLIKPNITPLPFLQDSPLEPNQERQTLQIQSYWGPPLTNTVCSAYWFLVRTTNELLLPNPPIVHFAKRGGLDHCDDRNSALVLEFQELIHTSLSERER